MSELLVELRWDILPSTGLSEMASRLERSLVAELERQELRPRQAAASFTCRRLMVLFRGLPPRSGEHARAMSGALADGIAEFLHSEGARVPGPLRAIAAVWDGESVELEVAGVRASGSTIGHPLLSPRSFDFRDARGYASELVSRGIEIRERQRRQRLEAALLARASEHDGARPVSEPALLDRLVASCEIPGAVSVPLGEWATELPAEIVVHALAERLQGLVLVDAESGVLRPAFVTAIDRPDDPEGGVRTGYERAARRLGEELLFCWQEDRALPLAERARLERQRDEERKGRGRAERLVELGAVLGSQVGRQQSAALEEAAELIDADRGTRMVGRFPELRGIYAGLMAQREGYPERVWTAIYDQRQPLRSDGPLPRGEVGKLLAIAARVDRLVTLFDSSSRDSRAAIGDTLDPLLEIVVRGEVPVDLDLLVAASLRQRRASLLRPVDELLDRLRAELAGRVRQSWIEDGHGSDEVDAVLEASGGPHLLSERYARLRGLNRLRHDPAFPPLVHTAHRIAEMLRGSREEEIDPEALTDDEERQLHRLLLRLRPEVERAVAEENWERWLTLMSELAGSTDRFVSTVLIHDQTERLRGNRLALLQSAHRLFCRTIRLARLS